jgi:three-Cys-motif partner protein
LAKSRHQFGGDRKEEKLDVITDYLRAYLVALKNQPFVKGYIDAFAGTGYRQAKDATAQTSTLFPDLAEAEPQAMLDGSARRALRLVPPFDRYVFIEQREARCAALESLKEEFSGLADRIQVRHGEANKEILSLCGMNWSRHRAVMFLDPYGMQVEWGSIEAIASTKAIDLWLLFPLGIGVNRLLTRSGQIPAAWRNRLDVLLGTSDWFEAFYGFEAKPQGLFDDEPQERIVKASIATIGRYFNKRLTSVFPKVADSPRVLRNSKGSPLYLLCFAAGNEAGAPIAVRIAEALLARTD